MKSNTRCADFSPALGDQYKPSAAKRLETRSRICLFIKRSKLALLTGLAAPAIIILCGCSTVNVTTDYDHSVPFGTYHTYALEPPPNVPPLSPTSDSALRSSLREALAARGIREVTPADKPDLAVVSHVKLLQKYSVPAYSDWGYGPGVWPYYGGSYGVWAGAPYTYGSINTYTEGTLILDFVDTSTQKLVFRGTGTAVVGSDAESNAGKITEAVKEIVAKLPVATQPLAVR
jgi:hypothetical protein